MEQQGSLFPETRYPQVPGWKGTDTSLAAARFIAVNLSARQTEVYVSLRDVGPATMHDLARRLGRSTYATAPRISELRDMGLVDDSGQRKVNTSSLRTAIVWQAMPRKGQGDEHQERLG